jgi:hypothetical protein
VPSPVVDGSTVYVGSNGQPLYALDGVEFRLEY